MNSAIRPSDDAGKVAYAAAGTLGTNSYERIGLVNLDAYAYTNGELNEIRIDRNLGNLGYQVSSRFADNFVGAVDGKTGYVAGTTVDPNCAVLGAFK